MKIAFIITLIVCLLLVLFLLFLFLRILKKRKDLAVYYLVRDLMSSAWNENPPSDNQSFNGRLRKKLFTKTGILITELTTLKDIKQGKYMRYMPCDNGAFVLVKFDGLFELKEIVYNFESKNTSDDVPFNSFLFTIEKPTLYGKKC